MTVTDPGFQMEKQVWSEKEVPVGFNWGNLDKQPSCVQTMSVALVVRRMNVVTKHEREAHMPLLLPALST